MVQDHGEIPVHIFLHIPPQIYSKINDQVPFECQGLHEESNISVQDHDFGFWSLVESWTGTMHAGHDHGSGWCCPHKSMDICFGRHSGYGGYGGWDRGARVLELQQDGSWQSWIRMENGTAFETRI